MSEEFKDGDQALPMYNPDAMQTLSGFVDTMFMLHDIKQEHCLPAKIVSYNRKTRLASVQPLVDYLINTDSGSKFSKRPIYDNIFVIGIGSADFFIDFPLENGDTGFLVSVDRNWKDARERNSLSDRSKNDGPVPPNDMSMPSFENGIFIPAGYAYLANYQFDGIALRNIDSDGKDVGGLFVGRNGKVDAKKRLNVVNDDKTIYLNPAELIGQYAKFSPILVPTGKASKDSDGITHIKTERVYVLSDEKKIDGEDILIYPSGDQSTDVSISTTSKINDIPISVTKSKTGNTIYFDIVLGSSQESTSDEQSQKGGENYCNVISSESSSTAEDGGENDISYMGNVGSGGGGGSSISSEIGNAISYYPCIV